MDTATCFALAQAEYSPKISTFARKTWGFIPGYEQQDLEAELLETLWKCVMAYHPDNGATFNTYFWRSAKNRTISLERHAKSMKRWAIWVQLDPQEFIATIDHLLQDFSAEEIAIANITVLARLQ